MLAAGYLNRKKLGGFGENLVDVTYSTLGHLFMILTKRQIRSI